MIWSLLIGLILFRVVLIINCSGQSDDKLEKTSAKNLIRMGCGMRLSRENEIC